MGLACCNGLLVLAEGLEVLHKLEAITAGRMAIPSGNLYCTKRTLVLWMSGRWIQRDGIALGFEPQAPLNNI